MDIALWSLNNDVPAIALAEYLDITEEQATNIYADIVKKRNTTRPLHLKPCLIKPVTGLSMN